MSPAATPPSPLARAELVTLDGNEACASVAYRLNEVCAIYPITPSSSMAELADQWSAEHRPNIWGQVPTVIEMQSEAGAAGAVHGSLQAGALTTTFTASQGLLLMIPNMYKIAGELTSAVFHVAARALATNALSIFGDHQDVMAVRATGFALLASSDVQEAHDLAAIAQMATLESRVPFLHFFDGFRTSHEIARIAMLSDDDLRAMVDDELVLAHRARALNPEHPFIRGTAQNPDVYFQGREAGNPYYARVPGIVQDAMTRFAARTGRHYGLVEYHGAPDADRVVVLMGSGNGAAREAVDRLWARGERVGVVNVRLYRPFPADALVAALPPSVRAIAVLDRTKEPGSQGEPLYQDVITALAETTDRDGSPLTRLPRVSGGRYGLGSKEFTPAMVKAVLDELAMPSPRRHFTIGVVDDVSGTSLPWDPEFDTESPDVVRAVFYGLGADGTVSANKNSIKIIGEDPAVHVQAYFVYDSKKSGSRTVSHLRFGPEPIRSTYLIRSARFVGVHQFQFIEKLDVLDIAARGATLLLNSPYDASDVWNYLPQPVQAAIIDKQIAVWVVDADRVAREAGLGSRTNSVMQTCFFAVSGVLPRGRAIDAIKASIEKTYLAKGREVVQRNWDAVDMTLARLEKVRVPRRPTSTRPMPPIVPDHAPPFVRDVLARMMTGRGDELPVSAIPADGTFPSATSRWEKRNIAASVPHWDAGRCVQCGNCAFICPHACIRAKLVSERELERAPADFPSAPIDARGFPETRYTLHVSVEDCTGCELCVEVCPVRSDGGGGPRAINMGGKPEPAVAHAHAAFFDELPVTERGHVDFSTVRGTQFLEPLFEFSGACAGCGETPYLKTITQLFGDRLLVANATGCSSIYGGNLPTTPWSVNSEGHGPAWSNSLFEDNAEFGLGMRLASDHQLETARELLRRLRDQIGGELVEALLTAPQRTEADIRAQRLRVAALGERLAKLDHPLVPRLAAVTDQLVRRSVWLVGGDGWAYDIGAGGLDHVLASGRDVNVLVLDTEVYSNTGGQASKATPLGASARFASAGKATEKKDLALQAISYGHIYVARIAMGANPQQTLHALREAEAYDGPSLVLAYSHCIAHGLDMTKALDQHVRAVHSGYWPLLRYNPELRRVGENALSLDSARPTLPLREFAERELRYRTLLTSDPERGEALLAEAQAKLQRRWKLYEDLAGLS